MPSGRLQVHGRHQQPLLGSAYLPINPADIHREYEPVIRINSQSGKGGAAFVMQQAVGYYLPKEMHPEFGHMVKEAADEYGDELSASQIVELFNKKYVDYRGKYELGPTRCTTTTKGMRTPAPSSKGM